MPHQSLAALIVTPMPRFKSDNLSLSYIILTDDKFTL